jgi:hypothetical protein
MGDRHGQVQLVVKPRRLAKPQASLGQHDVNAPLEHRLVAPVCGAQELGHPDVEVVQVVRVERDSLEVGLAVADPQRMYERRTHAKLSRRP